MKKKKTLSPWSPGSEEEEEDRRRPRRFHARSDYFTIKIRKLPDKELYAEAEREIILSNAISSPPPREDRQVISKYPPRARYDDRLT